MAGDPFGLLLRQRIVFLGGEVCPIESAAGSLLCSASTACTTKKCWRSSSTVHGFQVVVALPAVCCQVPPFIESACCTGERLQRRCYHQPAAAARLAGPE